MEHLEHSSTQPGYSLVELRTWKTADTAPSEEELQDLQRELDGLQGEVVQAHTDLTEVERQARAAVEAEDAGQVADTWNEKHRLLNRISELQQQQLGIQRELQAGISAALAELSQERSGIERQRTEEAGLWRQMIASAEGLVETLHKADQLRAELHPRERLWGARLETLASRELSVLADARPEVGPASRPSAARSLGRTIGRSGEAWDQSLPPRQWSLYDPDSGKLVKTLGELSRLLVRWYPALRTEEERVREFLTLPNAEPLPDQLRQELEQAGYLNARASGD